MNHELTEKERDLLEFLKKENQSYRDNLPKFHNIVSGLSSEVSTAKAEAVKFQQLYKQAKEENIMLNKFNIAFIGMSLGVIGATLIFLATHTLR